MPARGAAFTLLVALTASSLAAGSRFKKPVINPSPRDAPDALKQSDEKFMKDDLPADNRPNAISPNLAFGHPYPAVQEHADYDSDYVQDQNKDHGEWATQWEYDRLRSKVRKEQKEMLEAQAKMELEKQELERAKEHAGWASGESAAARKRQADSESRDNDAESRRAAAANEENDANGRARSAGNHTSNVDCTTGSKNVREACREVQKEAADVEDSYDEVDEKERELAEEKKQLAAAKKRLADLQQAERDGVNKANADERKAADADAAAAAKRREELEKQKAQADADMAAARAAARAADKKEKDSQGTVAEEQREYDAAKANYEKQRQEYLDAVKALQEAEDRLNDQRRGIGPNGAVYNPPEKKKSEESKSGAFRSSAALAVLAAAVATFVA
eukprot:gnl/TRDRNA2_/TRDRNA2_176999_c0_seq13.p1 gnl/TRDRNA2_/TRDRNA2_176999_c0~~gnl/TRDRNA2_/TRDRNA2_176999_c0_seq13.p1  ORF type:complete len:392 (+),score=124.67 gnl/TRDRNA2_/TRDRNA2_176999_c0_seq13:99-1274(+)